VPDKGHARRASPPSAAKNEQPERTGARPQWSGTISFGLVSIPVDLYSATRSGGVPLRMLGPEGNPLSRRFYCSDEQQPIDSSELVRGYELRKDEYVVISDEELQALDPDKSRDIDLRLFVPADAIDPVYFERSYFLAPAGESSKAYHLLAEVMQRSRRMGVATFVMREKEYVVALHAEHGLMRATVLRFAEQLRAAVQPDDHAAQPDEATVRRLTKFVHGHKHERLDAAELRDRDAEALLALAHKKAKDKAALVRSEDAAADAEPDVETETVDLLQILKRSLGPANEPAPKTKAAGPRRPEAKRKPAAASRTHKVSKARA
jgi:DNA end-binding protein Ku